MQYAVVAQTLELYQVHQAMCVWLRLGSRLKDMFCMCKYFTF